MFRSLRFIITVIVAAVALGGLLLSASVVQAQRPVAYGLFFYSPSCPHCHEVMDNHWPGIQGEFGDQLRVLFVNVAIPEGSQLMLATTSALNINSNGVPMLVLGSDVMIGSLEIPARAPIVIRDGLANGGIRPPAVPGIDQIFEQAFGAPVPSSPAIVAEIDAVETLTVGDRLAADPIANTVAIAILIGMVASMGSVLMISLQSLNQQTSNLLLALRGRSGQRLLLVITLVGLALTVSLLAGSSSDLGVTALAGFEVLIFAVAAVTISRIPSASAAPRWLLPLIVIAGLAVAGYLAYVEVTVSEAVCGAVGDCNTVQQSPYARVLGIPVGVIGIVGYLAMLVTLGARRLIGPRTADAALFSMALFGTLFSAYLTFLEPFVIGASCAWCLTSSITMLLILWLVASRE
ncbi:MAG: hypothetical protein GYB67_16670 [Chloroflexi bacterium]|nr:hypothetical protein [Chloroflexota bacterium]